MKKTSYEELNRFIENFIPKVFRLHSILFEYPKVYFRFALLSLIIRYIPPNLISYLLNISLKRRKVRSDILIYRDAHTDKYISILKTNKIDFEIIDKYSVYAIKLTAYKIICKSRSMLKNIEKLLSPIIYFLKQKNKALIILPNDTYPDTYLLTQICKKYTNSKTLCVQHGSPARIYMNLRNLDTTIWDGMNSDLFLAWDKYSGDLMQRLIKETTIPKNKNLRILSLNSLPILKSENKISKAIPNDINITNYSFLIIEDCTNYIYFDKNSLFNKLTYQLSDDIFLKRFKGKIDKKILYKKYNEKSKNFSFITRENLKLVKSKYDLFKENNKLICFCGITTLAYELRVAGNFIIGIDSQKYGQDAFPKEIYNEYLDLNNLQYLELIEKKIIKFIDSNNSNQIFKNTFEDSFINCLNKF